MKCADDRTAIGQEIEARGKHRRLPWVRFRQFNLIHHIGFALFGGKFPRGLNRLGPELLSALEQFRRQFGFERLRQRDTRGQISDSHRGDFTRASNASDGMPFKLINLGGARRDNPGGVG